MDIIGIIKEKSKYGIIAVGLYLLFVLWTIIEARTCEGIYCGFVIIMGVLPWALLPLGRVIQNDSLVIGIIVFSLLVLINALIIYFIGYFVQKRFGKSYK